MKFRVTFERIGRNKSVTPLEVECPTEFHLADKIAKYARPHLRSSEYDVVLGDKHGYIVCGMHNGGDFKFEVIDGLPEEPCRAHAGAARPGSWRTVSFHASLQTSEPHQSKAEAGHLRVPHSTKGKKT